MYTRLIYAAALSVLVLPAAYGQEEPVPQTPTTLDFSTSLSGAQEVPEVPTAGSGNFSVRFDEDLDVATYVLEFTDTTSPANAAHLHCAAAGENGPVVVPLALPTGAGEESTFTNDDIDPMAGAAETCGLVINNVASLFTAILQEKIYVNVHTETYPAGELRGQLFSVQLSTEDEEPTEEPTL